MEFALIIGWRVAIFNTFRAYPASSVPRTSAIPSLFDAGHTSSSQQDHESRHQGRTAWMAPG